MVVLRDEADEVLMTRYQNGETQAFEILLCRHRKAIFNFILRFMRSRELAEDLMQETFLRVIKGATRYERKAKFTTWLYTIARNLCVDHLRRKKHRKAQSLDTPLSSEEGPTLLELIPGQEMAADRQSLNNELHQKIHNALYTLSVEQREVFLMRETLDMPFREIAQAIGASENTVKSRMRYALEKLRTELEEYKSMAKALP